MGQTSSKHDESKHNSGSSRPQANADKNKSKKQAVKDKKAVTENPQVPALNGKVSPEETKSNADLVVTHVTDRLNWHSVNTNFLISVGVIPPLAVIIFEYANFYDLLRYDLIDFAAPVSLGLFRPDQSYITECKQSEAIARDHILTAGPLDGLEKEARKNPNALLRPIRTTMTLDGIDFTFEGSPLQLAIMLLDQTVQSAEDSTGPKTTDEGQAEKLMDLIQELMPERMREAQEQARSAAPEEDEKASEAKESKILKDAFDKIKANDPDAASKIIRDHIINTKPAVITDNQYFLNLLKLIPTAFNLLLSRACELKGGLYGDQADQYCFKIIGTIDRVFPFKLRKILRTGLYSLLYQGGHIDRTADVRDALYLSGVGWELAVNLFFTGASGAAGWPAWELAGGNVKWSAVVFKTFVSNYISAAELMRRSNTHQKSYTMIPSNLAGVHRPF
ncbi:MAG TPA: hypothetical protein VLH77_06995 [Gammaproteobacteria bacterium]|nr:hypothetical protein [Gammaproteobacteria bacterium]